MRYLKKAIPHITIVLSLMTLTFFAIDRVNTGMAFMTSELSKWVFMLLAVFALIGSILLTGYFWRDEARALRRRGRKRPTDATGANGADRPVWDNEEDA